MIQQIDANTLRLGDGKCVRVGYPMSGYTVKDNLVLIQSHNPVDNLDTVTGTFADRANTVLFMQTAPGVRLTIDSNLLGIGLPSGAHVHFGVAIKQVSQFLDNFVVLVSPSEAKTAMSNVYLVSKNGDIVWEAAAIDSAPVPSTYQWVNVTQGVIQVANGALAADLNFESGKIERVFTEK